MSTARRLLLLVGLLVLALLACGLLYVALQTRNGWWLLGSLGAFVVLGLVWVRGLIALRRGRRRPAGR